MKKEIIYKNIADKFGTTVEEVKEEIQKVIDSALESLPFNSKRPTVDEFIDYLTNLAKNQ